MIVIVKVINYVMRWEIEEILIRRGFEEYIVFKINWIKIEFFEIFLVMFY